MDDRTCRSISGTQLVERNKVPCEEVVSDLFRKKDLLDRSLNTFTEEDIREATEQIRTTLKAFCSLPSETMQEPIPAYNAIIHSLQSTLVELTLALDQLSSPENKASFYKHLLVSQEHFADVFVHVPSETSEHGHTNIDPTPDTIINFPTRPTTLSDFSHTILPGIYSLIENPSSTCFIEYEQAIANLQTLDEMLERQKKLFKVPQYFYDNEYATLRRRLVVALAYTSELLHQLIHLLSTLQTHPRSKSKRMAQLREETLYSLKLFLHNFNDMLQKAQELNLLQNRERSQHGNINSTTSKKIISLRR